MEYDYVVIGNGSWATALVKILTDNQNKIGWWMRNESAIQSLKENHQNPHYLTSVEFNDQSIFPTSDLEHLLLSCDKILFAIPSAFAQEIIDRVDPALFANKTIISAIKGILPQDQLFLNEYLSQSKSINLKDYQFISGPCHAEEVAQERLSYLTIAGTQADSAKDTMSALAQSYINTIASQDVIGTQEVAVLKNIYALGAGIIHGLGYGDNFLSVYITNCYAEAVSYLYSKLAIDPIQLNTSAYLGDLLVTAYSLHSRNRLFGTMIGKGYSVKSAKIELGMIAEGFFTSKAFVLRNQSHHQTLNLPIVQAVYQILWEQQSPRETIKRLEESFK